MRTSIVLISCLLFAACAKKNKKVVDSTPEKLEEKLKEKVVADNSKTSLDWVGNYEGVIPCNDCEGTKVQLRLNQDETYTLSSEDINDPASRLVFNDQFTWDPKGNFITLNHIKGQKINYLVGENVLHQLGNNGEYTQDEISEKMNLYKIKPTAIQGKWKLLELNGFAIEPTENSKEAFLEILPNGKYRGSGGCNQFFGDYAISKNNFIVFYTPAVTEMACMYDHYDAALLEAIKPKQQFLLNKENELMLHVGKRKEHAKFRMINP